MMWRWAEADGEQAPAISAPNPFANGARRCIRASRPALAEEPIPMDTSLAQRLQKLSRHQLLILTHSGRKSGTPYRVTIWFIVEDDRLYLVSADTRRNWTRNVAANPKVKLEIGGESFEGTVEPISLPAEREHVMRLVQQKYWYALPFILAGRFLHAIGVVTDHSGAFEVKL